MDLCLLAGGVFDLPVPPMLSGGFNSMGALFTFERAFDLVRTYSSGANVIRELAPDSTDYMDRFCRAKAILTYMPIMTDKGYVETLCNKEVPNNIATLITPRFANEIYFYLSRRLVGTELYDLLISDHLKVQAPLEGGDTLEYRNLLNEMIPLRTMCLSLLSGHSNRFFHPKHLVSFPYYITDTRPRFTGMNLMHKSLFLRTIPTTSTILLMDEPKHGMSRRRR
jgi:hypothetical protein